MKMKAAVMRAQGKPRPYAISQPMTIETVDLDPPGPGEVLCKIVGAGLCHSDLSTIENLRPRRLPTIPGPEAAGIGEEVGPGVTGLKRGDHVVSMFVSSRGDCRYCDNGRPNLCQSSSAARAEGTLVSGARRLSLNGEPLHHYSGLSVFAQYAVVSQSALIKIPEDVPLEDAAIFGCAVVTGMGAVLNTAQVPPGARMAVVGLGGVGMNALMAGVVAGAERIGATFSFPHAAHVTDEKTIRGSYMGSCVPKRDIPRFIALCQRGRLPVHKLRSGFVTFEQINEGFDKLADGAVLRQVPRPHA